MGNLTLCDCYQIEIEFMHVDQTFEETHRACTDLGTQALLAVNSFKLHLTALKKFLQIFYF